MNIRQIVELTGCSRQTVNRVAKEIYPSKFENGKKTIFDETQSIEIVKLLRKQGFITPSRDEKLPSQIEKERFDRLESGMTQMQNNFNLLLKIIGEVVPTKTRVEKIPEHLISAKLEPKDEIRKIINQYTARAKTHYRQNWNLLYQEAYYRLGINFKVRGHKRNKSPLTIADEMGFIYDLLAIAREIFQLGTV